MYKIGEHYFDDWNFVKKEIHFSKERPYFKKREVWWASVGQNIGDEQNGKNIRYERPVLIVQKYYNNLFLALPLSTKVKKGNYYFRIVGEKVDGVVILSQGRIIDAKRLIRKIETVEEDTFSEIVKQYKDLF